MENDFNTYAEMAMTDPESLSALSAKYPPIARKTQIPVQFYTGLAPQMRGYLKSVGLAKDCNPAPK